MTGSSAIEFGDCSVDFAARRLVRRGRLVPLEPKMFQLLEVLISRRPSVVSNNELDEILWPDVYVARTSLTRLVSDLRALIGDSPKESRIIRTVYKSGYAFCADIRSGSAPALAPAGLSLWWNNQRFPLVEGVNVAGRDAECNVVIDSKTVSRKHARITVAGNRATLEDLGSTNGTEVNGQRISAPVVLADGDQITLGKVVLQLTVLDGSAVTFALRGDG